MLLRIALCISIKLAGAGWYEDLRAIGYKKQFEKA